MKTPNRTELKWSALTLLLLVAIISAQIFSEFLFGNKLYLFSDIGSDTLYNYYPIYYMLVDYFQAGDIPFWTFRVGAGISMFSFYQHLFDPFVGFLYIAGVNKIAESLIFIYLVKIFLAASFSYLYLCNLIGEKNLCLIGAISFAFSGFLMGFGQHNFYASWIIFFPLLLLAIDLSIINRRQSLIVICSAVLALNIAIFWQMAVLGFLYLVFRFLTSSNLTLSSTSGIASRSQILRNVLSTATFSTLGLGLGAVLWLPEYLLLSSSPRISSETSSQIIDTVASFLKLHNSAFFWSAGARAISNNYEGIGSNYTGYMNYYESLQLYCGVLWLLVIPQYWTVFSKRNRLLTTCAVAGSILLLSTHGFSIAMNGFQYPSYRWGYGLAFFQVIFGTVILDAMIKSRRISLPILLFTFLTILIFILALDYRAGNYLTIKISSLSLTILLFLSIYSILLLALVRSGGKPIFIMVILGVLSFELVLEHRPSFQQRSLVEKGIEKNSEISFFDNSASLIRSLPKSSDSFYRVEKQHWILSLNDSMVQNYNSLDSYNSLNHPSFIKFFKEFFSTRHDNVLQWDSQNYSELSDILSVKYLMSKSDELDTSNLTFIDSVDGISLYERKGFLPFGFTYNSFMLQKNWRELSSKDKARAMLHTAVVEVPWVDRLNQIVSIPKNDHDSSAKLSRTESIFSINQFDDDKISGEIDLKEDRIIFLSIPYDQGWNVLVNGKAHPLLKVNIGFSGLALPAGKNKIELEYTPLGFRLGIAITLVCSMIILMVSLRKRRSPV